MTTTGSDPLVRTQPRTRVFLSYSRRDEKFVRQLAAALEPHGYAVDFDQSETDAIGLEFGISAQDRWWLRLKEMIAAADVMVFAISPDSIASRVCDDEIAYANSLGKRIIPVLRRAIDYERAPERVRALNVKLSFESDDQKRFAHTTERLCAELDLDLDWHRRAARLARLAQQWDADSRPPGQLLRAGAIAEAEAWAARRPSNAPTPGPLLLEFLGAGRAQEEQDRIRLQTSELNARLKAGEALFERALVHVERAAYLSACECLLEAAALAPAAAIPGGFAPTLAHAGWARKAWTAASCIAANLPLRVATYEDVSGHRRVRGSYVWFDRGTHLLIASDGHIHLMALSDHRAVPVLFPELTGRVVGVAGAARAPRACVLTDDGCLQTFDLRDRSGQRANLSLQHDSERLTAAVGIDDAGEAIVLAFLAPGGNQLRVDVFAWDHVDSLPERSFAIAGSERELHWAGFSPDAAQVAALCDGRLRIFDRQGTEVDHLQGAQWRGSGVARDLSSFATPQYDLVQVFRRSVDRWKTGKPETATEMLVLQGATSLVADVIVTPQAVAILASDLSGRVLEWRPQPEVERGSTTGGVQISQSFGTSNRLDPSNRLEGLPDCSGIALHPQDSHDVLVAAAGALERWRLVDPSQPLETVPSLGPCARIVIDPASGIMAAATEQGVWTRRVEAHGEPGAMMGPSGVVWDVAIAGGRLAATCPDGSVRIWKMHDGAELEHLRVEAHARSLLFSPDGNRLFIGLANGVLWEWSYSERLVRIAALGVGPVIRLRMSANGRIGVAAGRTPDSVDDFDRMHSGVAAWSPERRHLLWTTERFALHPHDVDVSPDGAVLFVADMREALALSPDTGAVLSRVQPPQSDASKPGHVTAICCGPDGRTAFLGLWDGSIVHVDILSKQVIGTVKAHARYVSSISIDSDRGVLASASPVPYANHLAVWQAWDPQFFREYPPSADWIAEVKKSIETKHGTSAHLQRAEEMDAPLGITSAAAEDPVAEARAVRGYDEMRAADLLAHAAASGRITELSPDERRLAGEVLLATDAVGGMELLEGAARSGSAEAHVAIGVHLLARHQSEADWARALPHFRKAAAQGHAHGAYLVGYYHDRIDGGFVAAVNWRSIAAPTGVPAKPDRRKELAREWYERAAAAGSMLARERLADMSEDVQGSDTSTSRSS
jgi:WD40 repeat protein